MNDMSGYMVDVMMPVYNHERYLAQAIESIATQQTNFPFRLFVADDCSPDNSRAVISKYAAMYPKIVFPIFHEKNLGASGNGNYLSSIAEAKYVAICEGDDYWIDPLKLQKQVDFMEANPDYSICFSDVEIINERGVFTPEYFTRKDGDTYTIEDFILSGQNIIPTPTILFRNLLPKPLPRFYLDSIGADRFIQIVLAHKGKAKHLKEKMAMYRDHSQGLTKSKELEDRGLKAKIDLYKNLNEYLDYKYDALFRIRLFDLVKTYLIYESRNKKGFEKLKHYRHAMADYIKYSDKLNIKELVYYHMILFFPSVLKLKKSAGA
jgi:glycosyltransferase involved in cell wall biosynthesis